MADKKQTILDTALRLFGEKGYHQTSMQDIAEAAGVAKGSMYLYFKSKEDLICSVFKYYEALMVQDMILAESADTHSPKEHLKELILIQTQKLLGFGGFFLMFLNEEFSFPRNAELKEMIMRSRAWSLLWYKRQIIHMYGPEVEPYSFDCAAILLGIYKDYISYMILERIDIDLGRFADMLLGMMDRIVEGFKADAYPAVMSAENLEPLLVYGSGDPLEQPVQALLREVTSIKDMMPRLALSAELAEEVISCLQVMEEELEKPKPKRILLQGMHSFLRNLKIPGIEKPLAEMEDFIKGI